LPEIGAGLPVPAVLGELFGARVGALSPGVRRALLAVALSAGLTGAELAAVTDPLAVEDAEAAGVLAMGGGRVRAAHPLLAAAAAGQAAAAERRDLHAALGAAVGDPVLAARHRALAATGPEPALAGEVAGAAARAAARGAVHDAVELAGHALRLTGAGNSEYDGRLVALAWARVLRGRGIGDLLVRSAAVPPGTASISESSVDRPAGVRLAFRGELAAAREVFAGLLAAAEQRGEARSGVVLLMQLCEVELRAGDTAAAARALGEFDQWAALEPEAAGSRARLRAVLAAVRGDPGRATALAAQVLQASESTTTAWNRLEARRAAGVAALLARDPEQAVTSLSEVWQHTEREGVEDPGAFPVAGDLAEALAQAGQFAAAGGVVGRLAHLAAAQQHPWGLATADRAAAMAALARGYDDAAAAQLAAAAGAYRALGAGWEAARALLVLGRAQRRAKKRAAARESLAAARAGFEQLGCPAGPRRRPPSWTASPGAAPRPPAS
jgi:hypothetical protein